MGENVTRLQKLKHKISFVLIRCVRWLHTDRTTHSSLPKPGRSSYADFPPDRYMFYQFYFVEWWCFAARFARNLYSIRCLSEPTTYQPTTVLPKRSEGNCRRQPKLLFGFHHRAVFHIKQITRKQFLTFSISSIINILFERVLKRATIGFIQKFWF